MSLEDNIEGYDEMSNKRKPFFLPKLKNDGLNVLPYPLIFNGPDIEEVLRRGTLDPDFIPFLDEMFGWINNQFGGKENCTIYFLTSTSKIVPNSGILRIEGKNNDYKGVWKYSKNSYHEYVLLNRIQEKHKGKQKYVIKSKGESRKNFAVELEFIKGHTLNDIIKDKGVLSADTVLKYSSHLMNGLIEMRQAGIWYHRDIRPANIMIDEENDRAVIIDLGIATTDKHALPLNNRRFGGPNDLTSLGQVMYYMATGKHLFDQSRSMSMTFGSVAEQINDYRNKVYADSSGLLLQKHLEQVDTEIQDATLNYLIKSCLIAKHYEYKKMQRMFERYEK